MQVKKQNLEFLADGVLHIRYGNGAGELKLDTHELPESVYIDCPAARHGLMQKLGDAKSGGTPAEKKAEVELIWGSLKAGDWNRRGTGEGLEALMERVFLIIAQEDKKKAAAGYERYLALDDEAKGKFKGGAVVKAAIEKAKAERKLLGAQELSVDELFEM